MVHHRNTKRHTTNLSIFHQQHSRIRLPNIGSDHQKHVLSVQTKTGCSTNKNMLMLTIVVGHNEWLSYGSFTRGWFLKAGYVASFIPISLEYTSRDPGRHWHEHLLCTQNAYGMLCSQFIGEYQNIWWMVSTRITRHGGIQIPNLRTKSTKKITNVLTSTHPSPIHHNHPTHPTRHCLEGVMIM
jgi:hypothetical protein